MASLYDVSAEAQDDLFEIWRHIAEDSIGLANRIEDVFYDLFEALGIHSWWCTSPICESNSNHGCGAGQTQREAPSKRAF
jgi:hypothetical protein